MRTRSSGRCEGESEGFEVSTITGLMTVDEYDAKVASGEVPEDGRVELIEGRLVRKVTKNPPHTYSIYAVRDAIPRSCRVGGMSARKLQFASLR